MPAKQRHDIGRKKWNATADERRQAEQRRMRRKKLARRVKLRAARSAAADTGSIAGWREAKRKTGS